LQYWSGLVSYDAGCSECWRKGTAMGSRIPPIGPLAIALRRFGAQRSTGLALAVLFAVLLVVGVLILR
jgi:hypothetical protein